MTAFPLLDHRRLGAARQVRVGLAGLLMAVALAACGGAAAGGPGAAAGGGFDGVIAAAQTALGSAMIAGTVENGDTLKITLSKAAGKNMAKLFLCSNIKDAAKAAGLDSAKVVMVDDAGTQLATLADCRK